MNRNIRNWTCLLVAALALTFPIPQNLLADSPGARAGSTTFTLTDEDLPAPSGIVWGATSDGYRNCDFARAGNPQCQRRITIPSNTRFYGGYYVGGGTPTKGAGRCIDDGTWGWDYSGILFPKRIALNWTAKGRYQGGTGAYKTDGPKLKHD